MENEEKLNSTCPNCGSQLRYHTKLKQLKCISCSSVFDIESLGKGKLDHLEDDYFETIKRLRETKLVKETITSLNCKNCGAMVKNGDNVHSTVCPFCGSNHVFEEQIEEEVIPITGVIPFNISKRECNEKFHKWIKGKFFAPSAFKNTKFELDLYPIYLPYWTFDMKCITDYEGSRGEYYYEEHVREDSEGNKTVERERKTRWYHADGTVYNSFDDVLVLGSTNEKNRYYIAKVSRYNFEEMQQFNPKFLMGYVSERISLPLIDGFKKAQESVDFSIRNSIDWDIGGDEQRIYHYHTKHEDVTFKQVLVPVYNGLYSYQGKQYNFVMNGQTGQFAGGHPTSGAKIAMVVLLIASGILAFILFVVLVMM